MDNHLLLQKGNHTYILLSYPDRYHIITVDKHLDEKTEEKLLSGCFSDQVMDEMGLTRETVRKADLRGISISGYFAGDTLILYTKNKKLKFELADYYDLAFVDSLFSGIERFKPPKNGSAKIKKEDWRTPLQSEKMQTITKIIGMSLNTIGLILFFITAIFGRLNNFYTSACILLMVISAGMYFAYQPYYYIFGEKLYKELGYTAKVTHLDGAMLLPAYALFLRCIKDFRFTNWVSILIGCIAACALVTTVLYLFSKDCRKERDVFILAIFFTALLSFGIVGHVNHLLNFEKDAPIHCTVVDKHASGGKTHIYRCTVIREDGIEMDIPIDAATYRWTLTGETIPVHIETGALGIEYAYTDKKP